MSILQSNEVSDSLFITTNREIPMNYILLTRAPTHANNTSSKVLPSGNVPLLAYYER